MAADPALLHFIAIIGASALALFIVAIAVMSGMQAVADNSPGLLSRMLATQGLDPVAAMIGAQGREFALAVRRCTRCPGRERCREWLASGSPEGYHAFCPNAAFVDALKAKHR